MNDAESRLFSVIAKIRGSDAPLDLDTKLASFIRDSIDFFELQMAIEDAFEVEIDTERFVDVKTVRDLLELLPD
jgi:acyl carrier protein